MMPSSCSPSPLFDFLHMDKHYHSLKVENKDLYIDIDIFCVLARPALDELAVASKWNSSTCRSQWALLGRIRDGPRAKQFPQLAALFSGSADDKQKALYKFMSANEDPGAAEASFSVRKGHSDVTNRNRQWLTIREMSEKGCS